MASNHLRRPAALAVAFGIALAAPATPVLAEEGDYAGWQTALNLLFPPGPDNPVRASQKTGPYPLLPDPSSFDDGFNPGSYYTWQTIRASPSTGAVCGNGSPYKFFVNRVPHTRNTIIYMEGGGACWDYASCTGQTGVRGARNPNGIPDDYLSLANPGASLVSPFVTRINPLDTAKTQNWNMVYIPYCTGDVYSGDRVATYADPTGQQPPLVWHHNGLRNTRAVVAWLKNNLPRPTQMLSTGCSAGGTGSLTNYASLRRDLAPTRGYLINDSGPIFPTPQFGDSAQFPSVRLHTQIRNVWGLDAGPLAFIKGAAPAFDLGNLGSIYPALSSRFPGDRMGHTHFWQDQNYSSYSYERFYPEIANAPASQKPALITAKWSQDTARLRAQLDGIANVGGYFPQFRDLNESHCTTVVDFNNGDVQERNLQLDDFINSVLDGSGTVLDASEASDIADRAKPLNPLYALINLIL